MRIKGRLVSYFIISIVFPAILYVTSIFGNDMLKQLTSLLFILNAVIIFFMSVSMIKIIFRNRGHEVIDKSFVIRTCLVVIFMYLFRYLAITLFEVAQIPHIVLRICIMPFMFFMVIPFMKNYCINKKSIKLALVLVFIITYIILPFCLMGVEMLFDDKILVLTKIYKKYYIYEPVSNQWLINILNVVNVELPDIVVISLLNLTKFEMWCIVFLPYFVINFVLIDELSYRELCIELSEIKLCIIFLVMLLGILISMNILNTGAMELMYSLKHY